MGLVNKEKQQTAEAFDKANEAHGRMYGTRATTLSGDLDVSDPTAILDGFPPISKYLALNPHHIRGQYE